MLSRVLVIALAAALAAGCGGGGGGGDGGGDDGGGGGSGGGDDGGGSTSSEDQVDLEPVGSDADASGRADWSIEGTHQKLKVEWANLDPSSSFELWVDGQMIALVATDEDGKGEIEFDNQASRSGSALPLPSELDPVSDISVVEIRRSGEVLLSGTF